MRLSKKDELVQKSLSIFYRHGFHATGMDMLAEETGISKTSIYNHFRTKEELILATLRLRDKKFRQWLGGRMEELASEPADQMLALFDALDEWFQEPEFRGCMFVKASSEYQDPSHPIHKQSAEHKRLLEKHMTHLAKKADRKNPEKIARQFMLLKEGAIVSAQLRIAESPAVDAKQAAIAILAMT